MEESFPAYDGEIRKKCPEWTEALNPPEDDVASHFTELGECDVVD